MKLLNLEQNSEEWELYRRVKIGASEAACICGVDPYKKPEKLFRQKYTGEKQWVSPQMERGKNLEPLARNMYEKITGLKFPAKVALHDEYDWMMASFDGYNEETNSIIEIKCPSQKTFDQIILEGKIPISYIYQMQHQMIVSGLSKCILIPFNGTYFEEIEVKRNEALIQEIVEKERHFYECLLHGEYT